MGFQREGPGYRDGYAPSQATYSDEQKDPGQAGKGPVAACSLQCNGKKDWQKEIEVFLHSKRPGVAPAVGSDIVLEEEKFGRQPAQGNRQRKFSALNQ